MSVKRKTKNSPNQASTSYRRIWAILAGIVVVVGGVSLVVADWYYGVPENTEATYVGRNSCVECHQNEHELWLGSDHDLAMDLATEATVLGDFNDAEVEHYGMTSKLFRKDGKFMVNTEGPDGKMHDFEIKYVFGVRPLQQYMVELEPPTPGSSEDSIGKVQVLRISWDTEKKEWFYLSPPDVDEKLATTDPLHWTGLTQNWNHYCADCHSTNLQKNHDLATNSYHTTFTDIDVSCETCHGPGSTHVELASATSLFWDRNLGYGLKKLKGEDAATQIAEIESCAGCHSRRQMICPDVSRGDGYYDQFSNQLLMPNVYHCDGQILDEDYVYGSFIQSKMFHKGIRCTDCHNPHSGKVHFEGNKLCTSCHAHPTGKYDTTAHHFHKTGSTGASCVECHMPETTYMEVDPRRDHSIRIPRPDLSVELGTPNACTKCHLDKAKFPKDKHPGVTRYDQWIMLARQGDEEVAKALKEVDEWAVSAVDTWYGENSKIPKEEHFSYTLARAWDEDPEVGPDLIELVRDQQKPGIVRASAMSYLRNYLNEDAIKTTLRYLGDSDPQVRLSAIEVLQEMPAIPPSLRPSVFDGLLKRLEDDDRAVRAQAAWALANQQMEGLEFRGKDEIYRKALQERMDGLRRDSDQPSAHLSMGVLYERMGETAKAERAYRNAIRIAPQFTGARSNLINILDQRQRMEEGQMRKLAIGGNREAAEGMTSDLARRAVEIAQLRMEELSNLRRDASLQPEFAPLQYQFGLALYLAAREMPPEQGTEFFDMAFDQIKKAKELRPNNIQYAYMFALLCQFLERWDAADKAAANLVQLDPQNPQFRMLQQQISQRVPAKK